MNVEQARFNMIEQQIRPWDVLDLDILALLGRVKREDFVPQAYKALAFVDCEVPLVPGGAQGQVMPAPKVEARLLPAARAQPGERVLEIGTGSGFMAALLAHRAMQVTTLECVPELVQMARHNLRRAGLGDVNVLEVSAAQGAAGLPGEGPFDVIVLSGSVAEVPQALLDQLKPGGRLLAIVGQEPVMRAVRITRHSATALDSQDLFDTVAPRLLGFAEAPRFQF